MRLNFIYELFHPKPEYDWESEVFTARGLQLLEESKKLDIFKEISSQQSSLHQWFSELDEDSDT